MLTDMLEYLERTVRRVPEKIAFCDDREKLTFGELEEASRRIGTALAAEGQRKNVAILMNSRSICNIPAIYGALYAGWAYAPLDISMPGEQLFRILQRLEPGAILADEKGEKALLNLPETGVPVIRFWDAVSGPQDEERLRQIREKRSALDPMSILYTSGSTGIPKGSVQTEGAYLHWTEATIRVYGFDETVTFGNQSPFFYANSIIDIFPPVALGATVYLLPAGILNFPQKLIECLNEHRITELTMTPSSFIGIANAGVLERDSLPWLRYGIMSGESMPWQPLKVWMEAATSADWWHFYGSTEMFSVAVGKVCPQNCAGERLPVGKPFSGVHLLFLDEQGGEASPGMPGEMLVSSPWVSVGYHRDDARTGAAWVTDPRNQGDGERFYRSGDIGYMREDGQLMVLGRRDTQIKHRGYRMELGEVEAALRSIPGWRDGCVLFDGRSGKVGCFFTGELDEKEVKRELKKRIVHYMMPDIFIHREELPYTASMKLDRARLRSIMEEQTYA